MPISVGIKGIVQGINLLITFDFSIWLVLKHLVLL